MHDRAVAGERGGFDDLVVPVNGQRFTLFVDQELDESKDVLGVEARGCRGEPTRDVTIADDLDTVDLGHRIGTYALNIAAPFDGEVDYYRAGPHRRHHVFTDESWRRPAGNERGRDHNVLFLDVLGDQGGLLGLIVFRHFLGIAAGRLGGFEFLVFNRDKFRAEA